MRYKPPNTRGVGGFFSTSPNDESKEEKINDPLVEIINAKVLEYYKTHNERPNALVLGSRVYHDVNKEYIKGLRMRGIVIVILPCSEYEILMEK